MNTSNQATGRTKRSDGPVGPLPAGVLRWTCDPAKLAFESTEDVEPITGVVGQDDAVEALRFGLETNAPGQNVFVRGLTGTGRMTLLKRLLEEIQPSCPLTRDRCYVHNFAQPDRPRLITLPRGKAKEFRRRIEKLADFIGEHLGPALSSEAIKARRTALERAAEQEFQAVMKPFNEALRAAGLAMVSRQVGPITQTVILPLVEGKPVPSEELDQLIARGQYDQEQQAALREAQAKFEEQLAEISEKVNEIRRKHDQAVQELLEKNARQMLGKFVDVIEKDFPEPSVRTFLNEVFEDVVANRLPQLGKEEDELSTLYRVNIVLEHKDEGSCSIIIENTPTMRNLLGTIDYEFTHSGEARATHMGIGAGSLLRADGGYLILEARDVLSEPGAWKVLVRTLRTGRLEIAPTELIFPWTGPSLKPEPIDVHVKVILLGDAWIYHLLDAYDPDFPQLFKVLADFDATIVRDDRGINEYAGVLARIAREEELTPFDRGAVAALVEYGARVAARKGKLTARFGRLADIAREAAFIAGKENRRFVTAEDVRTAFWRSKRRADLPARRFRELVADGTIRVQTRESALGQVNGLAVLQAGPLVYGFPARITATIGPGTAGVINIEREAALSGAIHTKGFYILGGLLRWLLRTDHPLAFNASIAFEQSYGGIDGDSASGAEICCLLSALTDLPLRQDLAMTGAIDQMGNILPIGGVNEKIEGFFDVCRDATFTGTQGVIIPQANAGDLMLREDVVEAAREGTFHVYGVKTVHEALELFTGMPAGELGAAGRYPDGSLFALAVQRAREYWLKAIQDPRREQQLPPRDEDREPTPAPGGNDKSGPSPNT
ncbi:MAG TPA: ATP-binding protein [Phycisphaerae bacterium]|nr:ATP-binding protein [Phycisphaerae bacterium]